MTDGKPQDPKDAGRAHSGQAPTSEESKIIVDEDWKSQVQAEKEALRQVQEAETAEEGQTAEQPGPSAEAAEGEPVGPMPPASLTFLCTTLATQAMVALGLIPNPLNQKSERQLDQAKHFIDTVQLLQEKTEGNRTEDETRDMQTMLYELRMAYVSVAEQGGEKAD